MNLILPLLITLSEDENLIARQTCFESLVDLRNQLKDSQSIEKVGGMIISLVKFGLSSNQPTFTTTIALRISDLCQALTIFHIDECEFIHELFLRLCQEKVRGYKKLLNIEIFDFRILSIVDSLVRNILR